MWFSIQPAMQTNKIKVVAGILWKKREILIARRKYGRNAGKWEFPGGKIEDNERAPECLVREWQEELGVVITVIRRECSFSAYRGKIEIDFYLCKYISGRFCRRNHDRLKWINPARSARYDLCSPDRQAMQYIIDSAGRVQDREQ